MQNINPPIISSVSIKICQAQIEKQVIRILTIEKDLESLDVTKNLTKVQLAPEKRRNSLRDEFLLFLILCENLFGSVSSFDALTLPYFFLLNCMHINLHFIFHLKKNDYKSTL